MPNLYVTMQREPGWDTKTFYEELMKKAQMEKSKTRKPGYADLWDDNPIIKDSPKELQLTWRYKRFKKS